MIKEGKLFKEIKNEYSQVLEKTTNVLIDSDNPIVREKALATLLEAFAILLNSNKIHSRYIKNAKKKKR